LTIGEPAAAIEPRLSAAEPYRPDTVADGGEASGLTVRAASVRGLHKRYAGGPREDDLCLHVHLPTRSLIVAVADGVSAAPRSALGAALAVRQAVAAVGRQLNDGAAELDWSDVFDQAAWALVEEHRRERAAPSAGSDEAASSLATTLTVATISADGESGRVQLASVGDSPAIILAKGEFERVVGEADGVDGLVGGGVRTLPRHAGAICMNVRTLGADSVLLVCTDGLALPLADGHGDVGRTLARELSNPPDIVDFARLLDFSRSTYDDDRTLVAVWPRPEQ
jgi:Protein phosphatase 2C